MNEQAADPRLSCIIRNLSNSEYHKSPGISKSGLDLIARSPAHYKASLVTYREPTAAMEFGTAFHSAFLEPGKFAAEYGIAPSVDRRTKAGKGTWANWLASGKKGVTAEAMEQLQAMMASAMALPAVRKLMSSGEAEASLFHYMDDRDIRVRIRPDWINHELGMIMDVKTTEDASPEAFARSCAKYRYHVQAAFYSDVWKMRTGQAIKAFVFLAVEKSPPYAAALYVLDDEAIDSGRRAYQDDLATYAECRLTGEWNAYSTEPQILRLPKWAL